MLQASVIRLSKLFEDGSPRRILAFGRLHPARSGVPLIEVTYGCVRSVDPSIRHVAEETGVGTGLIPVSQLKTLRLEEYHWKPIGKPKQRWRGDLRGGILNAVFDIDHENTIIVRGFPTSHGLSSPYCVVNGPDQAWMRVENKLRSIDGRIATRLVYIPCTEVVRYFFGHTRMLLDAFNGDILRRPPLYRYPGIVFDGVRFRSQSQIENRADWRRSPSATPEDEEFAYRSLRAISWFMIEDTQRGNGVVVKSLPPITGACYLLGLIGHVRLDDTSISVVLRIDSLSVKKERHFASREVCDSQVDSLNDQRGQR